MDELFACCIVGQAIFDESYNDVTDDSIDLRKLLAHSLIKIGTEDACVAKILLAAGADPNIATEVGDSLHTPLFVATKNGNIEIVRILLAAGADPNIITSFAGGVDLNIFTPLVGGADPNIYISDDLSTPLYVATTNNDATLVRILLEAGADPNIACDEYEYTPLVITPKWLDCCSITGLRWLIHSRPNRCCRWLVTRKTPAASP